MIPRMSEHGCPKNSEHRDELNTCSCEDHCSWDLCRLETPPKSCLSGTNSNWRWNRIKSAWSAQISLGNKSEMPLKLNI